MTENCPICQGKGYTIVINIYPCGACHGSGYEINHWSGRVSCPYCSGTGEYRSEQHPVCWKCGGKGQL